MNAIYRLYANSCPVEMIFTYISYFCDSIEKSKNSSVKRAYGVIINDVQFLSKTFISNPVSEWETFLLSRKLLYFGIKMTSSITPTHLMSRKISMKLSWFLSFHLSQFKSRVKSHFSPETSLLPSRSLVAETISKEGNKN